MTDATKKLAAVSTKTMLWLDRLATAAENRAKNERFPSLAQANAFDARNYRAVANDFREALAALKEEEDTEQHGD